MTENSALSDSIPNPLSRDSNLRDLVDRCFSITLHRLRGVRGLISGWIEIGVPPGEEHRLRERMEEDLQLLARLDWLRSLLHHDPPLERCYGGEAPMVLLAAALGVGTPEEAGTSMPEILAPEAAMALALWLQGNTIAYDSASIRIEWFGKQMEVRLAVAQDHDWSDWNRQFGHMVTEQEPHRLRFRPSCFARCPGELEA
ncbi:MAG: hypothetical protein ACPG31_03290 [Planctomycetota bacterium]